MPRSGSYASSGEGFGLPIGRLSTDFVGGELLSKLRRRRVQLSGRRLGQHKGFDDHRSCKAHARRASVGAPTNEPGDRRVLRSCSSEDLARRRACRSCPSGLPSSPSDRCRLWRASHSRACSCRNRFDRPSRSHSISPFRREPRRRARARERQRPSPADRRSPLGGCSFGRSSTTHALSGQAIGESERGIVAFPNPPVMTRSRPTERKAPEFLGGCPGGAGLL